MNKQWAPKEPIAFCLLVVTAAVEAVMPATTAPMTTPTTEADEETRTIAVIPVTVMTVAVSAVMNLLIEIGRFTTHYIFRGRERRGGNDG
jgi:hypothetical protein